MIGAAEEHRGEAGVTSDANRLLPAHSRAMANHRPNELRRVVQGAGAAVMTLAGPSIISTPFPEGCERTRTGRRPGLRFPAIRLAGISRPQTSGAEPHRTRENSYARH